MTETAVPSSVPERNIPLLRVRPTLLEKVGAIASSPAITVPVAVWLLSRLLFVILTYFGVILFRSSLHSAHPSFIHDLLPAWENPFSHGGWDTQWYINIAERGYDWRGPSTTSPTAFFPLYPLLIHLGVALTRKSDLLIALAISSAAFLGALLYLWRLAAWEVNRAVASRCVLYISVFPTALFFFAGYTESLFLFLTVASFFHMRRKEWMYAGIFGGFASATRVTGVLLMIPFLYEYARAHNFNIREMIEPRVAGLLLLPTGLIAFMIYLNYSVGDALAFSHVQVAWQKVFTVELWAGFAETVRQLLFVQPSASFYEAHNLINGSIGLGFLVASVFAARRLPASYTLYVASFWLVTLSSPAMAGGYPVPLISLSRYVLTLFPVFMYLGIIGHRRALHDALLVVFVAMLSLFTVQFLQGGWII